MKSSRHSQLEDFLASQRQGVTDSQGVFTLARDEALRKLASFRLPFEGAWALKLVQAAVAGGAGSIEIRQSSKETIFRFGGKFGLERFESAFFNPEPSGLPALDHLLAGMWAVALGEERPFELSWSGQTQALVWTGSEFLRRPLAAGETKVRLTISHRPAHLPGLGYLEAAQRNGEVLKALTERAYVCPLPLTVDNRRLDTLWLCPDHGLSSRSHCLGIGWAELPAPPFELPPGTFEGLIPEEQERKKAGEQAAARALEQVEHTPSPGPISVAWLASVHFHLTRRGRHKMWAQAYQNSQFHWILDGVVIAIQDLAMGERSFSLGVFASAQGLGLDITGFGLLDSEAREQRLAACCAAITQGVEGVPEVDLMALIASTERFGLWFGGALMVGGVLMMALSPMHSFFLGVAGSALMRKSGTAIKDVEAGLKKARSDFLVSWKRDYSGARATGWI
ncbi:MAG: hypothetical protein KC910_13560 [Candidatus Eremiobacteraeota bacterium]|nr:hypothetical protein [Candidatus Eremiobacteraeota bacterium]